VVKARRSDYFTYGVSHADIEEFVEQHECVKDYLNQWPKAGATYIEKSVGLVRFFRWLKVVQELDVTPAEFLDMHLAKRSMQKVAERQWALKMALAYSRDNVDLKDASVHYKYSAFYLPVKGFCDYHEVPLTASTGLFKKKDRRKTKDTPLTIDFVKKVLGALPQRERAVSLCQLQAGQAIKQVLVDMNCQAKRVFREIDMGKERIRFNFDERKGNGFAYFSFISRDAIQEIQKWRPIRQKILNQLGIQSDYIFITESGKPLSCKKYHTLTWYHYKKAGLYTGSHSVRSQGFRKFFEQEASPPERNISKGYVSFMMGHSDGKDGSGVKLTHPLDAVGGVYDGAPRVYPEVVEREYAKLEPYLNIYSGGSQGSPVAVMPRKQQEALAIFAEMLNSNPDKMRKFQQFLLEL
jgi:integrase